mgnify:CR=1 FL=1
MINNKLNKDKSKKYNIAIVGGGVSGLTSALLLSKKHNITLYESQNYLGGHALTLKKKITIQNRKKEMSDQPPSRHATTTPPSFFFESVRPRMYRLGKNPYL